MHHLVLPPIGWGFMLIHDWRECGARVLTDGGSSSVRGRKHSPSCYDATISTLGYFLTHTWKPRGKWAWIISHLDYDHYSVTLGLIGMGHWHKPELVVLPAVYDHRACREALATIHRIALLLATALRISRPPSPDLLRVIRNVKRIGLSQGAKLRTGELDYHVIWPPPPAKVGPRCGDLLRRLRKKLENAKKICTKMREGRECKEAWDLGEREAGDIIEIIAPETVYGDGALINLDELLADCEFGFSQGTDEAEHYSSLDTTKRIVYDYKYIYYYVSEKLKDREFYYHYRSIINDFSIAYALECNQCIGRDVKMNVELRGFCPPTACTNYSFILGKKSLWSRTPLLYLADLESALSPAIKYYKNNYLNNVNNLPIIDIGIEVAAHHGNSYSPELKSILPRIIFLPRCNDHVPRNYMRNYKYKQRYVNLQEGCIVYSLHNYGLEVKIYL